MGKTMQVTTGLVMAVCLGVAFLALSAGRPSVAVEPAPTATGAMPPLEAGKRYTFYWERGEMIDATALDGPRGNWIKVRYRLDTGKEAVHWVNLATVTHVVELPKGK
jgi:hypothetical protein